MTSSNATAGPSTFPGCLSTPATPFSFSTPNSPSHFTSSNGVSPHPLTKRQLGQRHRRQHERQRQLLNRDLTIHSPLHGDGAEVQVVVETNNVRGRRLKRDAESDDSVCLFLIRILSVSVTFPFDSLQENVGDVNHVLFLRLARTVQE